MFGFTDETKGHFPHKMASFKNLFYSGKFPAKEDFYVERMSKQERADFHKFYKESRRRKFNFREKALEYCTQVHL